MYFYTSTWFIAFMCVGVLSILFMIVVRIRRSRRASKRQAVVVQQPTRQQYVYAAPQPPTVMGNVVVSEQVYSNSAYAPQNINMAPSAPPDDPIVFRR
jgi:hypothetical protein